MGNLRRLRHLNLFENDIGGEIPPELGRLENLVSLHLSYNDLEGVIPRELGDLANLEILTLQDNDLSGGVPPELGASSSLRHLGLDSDIGGCIPNRAVSAAKPGDQQIRRDSALLILGGREDNRIWIH